MRSCLLSPLAALVFGLATLSPLTAAPAGTAISYQGQLNDGGNPATGSYEFRFTLHDAPAAGAQIGPTRTNAPVAVAGGEFTTAIDFGAGVFNGDARFLEIAVRPAGSAAAFTPLSPRQSFSPVPYALRALEGSAGPQGPAGATGATGPKGDKGDPGVVGAPGPAGVAGPKGDKGDPGATDAWSRLGNAGTTGGVNFLGTTDNQPLELRANNQRGLQLEYGSAPFLGSSVNVLGGAPNNVVGGDVIGATVFGGSAPDFGNSVLAHFGTVGGGQGNVASGDFGTVPGGFRNRASASNTLAAGTRANAIHPGAFVWADSQNADFASTTNDQFNVRAGGGVRLLGNGGGLRLENPGPSEITSSLGFNVIGGYAGNLVGADTVGATMFGGGLRFGDEDASNRVEGEFPTVSGGAGNAVTRLAGTVGGGLRNVVNGVAGTVPGGAENFAGDQAFAAGTQAKARHWGSFVWADSGVDVRGEFASTGYDQFLIRATGGVAIGTNNPAGSALRVVGTVTATALDVSGKVTATALNVSGTVTATKFVGDGSGLSGVAGGAQGPAGPKGATGATGPQGPVGPSGPQGPQGPKGDPGVAGPAGPAGATGPEGPAGAKGVNWRGPWSSGGTYQPGDAVTQLGASWIAKVASNGVAPVEDVAHTKWDLLADKGATGAVGPAGAKGDRGDTGLAGATGAQGPKGDKGDPGATGATGPQGPQGLVGAAGPVGPVGPAGAKGDKGDPGATGPAGATGPQGLKGDTGAAGPQGPQGIPGSSDGWSRSGNAGTTAANFLGTTDNQALELRVNNAAVLRLPTNGAAALGNHAKATNTGAFVFADGQNADFGSTAADQFSVRAQGGARFVTGAAGLTVNGPVSATGFVGNGSGLTGVNAATAATALTYSGPITQDQLPVNAVRNDLPTVFTASQSIIDGNLGVGTTTPMELAGGVSYPSDWEGVHSQSFAGNGLNIIQGANSARLHLRADGNSSGNQDFIIANGANQVDFLWLEPSLADRLLAMSIGADGKVTAPSFAGDGSGLTGVNAITAQNLTGTQSVVEGHLGVGTTAPMELAGGLAYPPGWDGVHSRSLTDNGLNIIQGANSARLHLRADGNDSGNQDFIIANGANQIDFLWLSPDLGGRLQAMTIGANGTVTAPAFVGDGSGLTGVQASQLAGALPDAAIPANVVRRDQVNSFTGNQTVAGTVTATAFVGDGSGLTGLNNGWSRTGNAGTTPGVHFLGTTDNQPLNVAVNGQRALRLEPTGGIPNVIGGDVANRVEASNGVLIGGGLGHQVLSGSDFSVIAGGRTNRIELSSSFAAILGGRNNTITENCAWAAIGGGSFNAIAKGSFFSVIGGGENNAILFNALHATIGGGERNRVQGSYGTIPGGENNYAVTSAFAAGSNARAKHPGAFVWADGGSADFESTANHQFSVRASGGARFVTGASGLTVTGPISANGAISTDGDATVGGSVSAVGSISAGSEITAVGEITAGSLYVWGNAIRDNGLPLWDIVSDERLKQHIRPYEHGLDAILKLKTKRFEYIDDPAHHTKSGQEQVGVIAQQVETVIPDAVKQGADGYRTLNASPIYWAAINAIQELNGKVEAKGAEITALKEQNRSLEARLAALEKLLGRQLETAANGGGR